MTPPYGSAGYDFAGAVAIATGGLSGIGAEAAGHLRRNGARVAVFDTAASEGDAWRLEVTDLAAAERATAEVALDLSGGRATD